MAYTKIYACPTTATMSASNELPSPTDLAVTNEQIWSANTGRSQVEADKAKMIGDYVASKRTYAIKWAMLRTDNNSAFPTAKNKLDAIKNGLSTGFFKFGVATGDTVPTGFNCYRSEIAYDQIQAGDEVVYRDVTVSVIEQ